MNQLMKTIEQSFMKKEVPDFRRAIRCALPCALSRATKSVSKTLKGLHRRHKGGLDETFTVRRVSFGVGMERIFPLHSPRIEEIQVVRHGRVRRSKLYYLRDLTGKQARIAETVASAAKRAA